MLRHAAYAKTSKSQPFTFLQTTTLTCTYAVMLPTFWNLGGLGWEKGTETMRVKFK